MVCDITCKSRLLCISLNLGLSGSGSQLHCCIALTGFSLLKPAVKCSREIMRPVSLYSHLCLVIHIKSSFSSQSSILFSNRNAPHRRWCSCCKSLYLPESTRFRSRVVFQMHLTDSSFPKGKAVTSSSVSIIVSTFAEINSVHNQCNGGLTF
jgi:hypothetical protein